MHASLGDQQVVGRNRRYSAFATAAMLLAVASATHTMRAPAAVRNVVNAMFCNFLCARFSWVRSGPSRGCVFLVAVLGELDDLAVLDMLRVLLAHYIVQAVVIAVAVHVDLAITRNLAIRHGSEELAKTTWVVKVVVRSYRFRGGIAHCPGR